MPEEEVNSVSGKARAQAVGEFQIEDLEIITTVGTGEYSAVYGTGEYSAVYGTGEYSAVYR